MVAPWSTRRCRSLIFDAHEKRDEGWRIGCWAPKHLVASPERELEGDWRDRTIYRGLLERIKAGTRRQSIETW